jgi:hypothetical protein
MRKFDRAVGLVSLCLAFGLAQAAEPVDQYGELYQVLVQKAAAPEQMGCVNRAPFGEGYACEANEPGAPFQRNSLVVDNVSQTYRNEVVTTTLVFSPDHCIAYDGFETHLLKASDSKQVEFWRKDHWYRPDGSGTGDRDDYRFYGAKKLSIFHMSKAVSPCITEIQMTKRIRSH